MGLFDRIAHSLGYAKTAPAAAPAPAPAPAAAPPARRPVRVSVGPAGRGFEAAETPHYAESFNPRLVSINEDLRAQLRTMRGRSTWLARNNEWARRYQLLQRVNVLGPAGVRLQMRLTKRDGTPNEEVNTRIERAWSKWGKRGACDVSGRAWAQCERILLDGVSRDGEILIRLVDGYGPHRFGVQILNPSVLDVELWREYGGRRVRMGVEVDDFGKPVAYWLRAARTGDVDGAEQQIGVHTRVPADRIIHRYIDEEIDQLRGMPSLAVGSRRLWLAQEYENSAAVASRNAAQRLGFFFTPNGEAPESFADELVSAKLEQLKAEGKNPTAEEIKAIQDEAVRFTTSVPGQYDVLPQGVQFQPFESAFPNVDHGEYVNHAVRGWTAGQGVSYVTVGNDLEAVNYSSAQVGILDEREQWKTLQQWLVGDVEQAVFEAWLPRAMLSVPELAALSFDRLEAYFEAATWQPRRWAGIDPLKEAEANERNLRMGLISRKRIILARGDDPDEIAAEIAAEEAIYGPLDANTSAASSGLTEGKPAGAAEGKARSGRRLRAVW